MTDKYLYVLSVQHPVTMEWAEVGRCTADVLDAKLDEWAEQCFMCSVNLDFIPPGMKGNEHA